MFQQLINFKHFQIFQEFPQKYLYVCKSFLMNGNTHAYKNKYSSVRVLHKLSKSVTLNEQTYQYYMIYYIGLFIQFAYIKINA